MSHEQFSKYVPRMFHAIAHHLSPCVATSQIAVRSLSMPHPSVNSSGMPEVSIRDLRNHGGDVLDRVEAGAQLTVPRPAADD
jgi:hypothetical protein